MFVFFLSSYLSVFLSACEQLHWISMLDFTVILHVARGFVNQSDCKTFQISALKKRLSYIKHVHGCYHVTRHSSSQQIDYVFLFGYGQACPT